MASIPLGILLAFTVGPVFFILIETSITKGVKAALIFDLGVILGDIFFISLAYFTTNSFLEKIKDDPRLFIFGGLILILYGIFSFFTQRRNHRKHINAELIYLKSKVNYFQLFFKGFLLNIINIGVLGFWLAILISFAPRFDMQPNRLLLFFGSVIGVYLLVDIFKILVAKQLRHKMNTKNIHKLKQIINIVIILFGLFLSFQGFFPEEKEFFSKEIQHMME